MISGFTGNKRPVEEKPKIEEKVQHVSRKDTTSRNTLPDKETTLKDEKENCNKLLPTEKGTSKKMRLLGKYFQVHKKLFIPLPGLFTRNRLYKAQSCSSLTRDKIANNPEAVLRNRQRAVSVIRNSIGSDGDINQNTGVKSEKRNSMVNNVCTGITDICAVHLGQASKCSFC